MRLPFQHRFSLATRLTAAFVLVAAIAGSLAAVALARTLLLGLEDGLDVPLRNRAQTLATQLTPQNPSAFRAQLGSVTDSAGLTQVIGRDGYTLAASKAAGPESLLNQAARARALQGTYIIDADRTLPASAGSQPHQVDVRLLGAPLGDGDIVVVGSPLDTVNEATSETAVHLLVAGLIGVVLAAIGARLLIGAVLRPVERARQAVEQASDDQRVPVLADPGGDDEFSALVRTFNRLLRRQHALLDAERNFTADAGHELRTPLTILSGELELAARPGRTPSEVAAALVVARDETNRLVRLTEQLLMLARGDVRTLIAPEVGDVATVVHAAISSLRPVAMDGSVVVSLSGPDTLLAFIDADRLRLAVDNLLRNAIRYAPAHTNVEVSLTLDGPADARLCALRVADRGPGFSPGFLPHAFDRFRRDDTARGRDAADTHGAGLGLAIVKAIVTAHDGVALAFNRAPGPGAIVGFDIPLGPASGVAEHGI